jgi:predicted nucleic acid-binding protein
VKGVFADTAYWIAISNPHDSLHDRARQISRSLPLSKLVVTSEMVFAEFLNDFGQRGEFLRRLAARLVARVRVDRNVIVVGQTRRQFREALALYSERSDKNWSLTDCASFRIMEQYGIREALTYDRHFGQAGFKALLRDD